MKDLLFVAIVMLFATPALASELPPSQDQGALSWAADGAGDLGLQLGIAGPSTVGFRPRRDAMSDKAFGYLPADEFDVVVRNVGSTPVHLCGVQPTFTIKATNSAGTDVGVLAGLGPAGMSMGPKIYSEAIAAGATWSPRFKVPLLIVDEAAPPGEYIVRARMEGLICNPDQNHLRGITLYSGKMRVVLAKSFLR